MGFSAPFAASCGKSSQVPVHEPFAHPAALSQSCPVKLGQTWLNHFLTWTNLDREQPSSHVRFGIKSGSPETCGVQGARKLLSAKASATTDAEIRGFLPFCILHFEFCISSSTPPLHSAAYFPSSALTAPLPLAQPSCL
jgi:hypothetical protein